MNCESQFCFAFGKSPGQKELRRGHCTLCCATPAGWSSPGVLSCVNLQLLNTQSPNHLFVELPSGLDCSQANCTWSVKTKLLFHQVWQTSPPEGELSKSHLTLQFGAAEFAEKHRIYNTSDRSRLI